jgi:hypothetical protein
MSARVFKVHDMTNPSVMQQLAREHAREILEAGQARTAAAPVFPAVRRRLGWSLIGLGVHLALDGSGRGTPPVRREPWRPLVRP